MPKNLLIICQKVDENDDLLGFFVSWIAGFATHFVQVDVIALGVGTYELPANVHVHSLGKERGVPKWRQALRMTGLLWKHTPEHGAVFCHMSPIFAIVAWPFATLRRSRLVLWYLHRSRTLKLRLALMLCDRLVTADAESLSVRSQKIIAVGHGIDVERFTVSGRTPPVGRPLRILSVGRLSPIKGFETLIRATAHLRENDVSCEVRIVGKAVMPGDRLYEEQLRSLTTRLRVSDAVHFFGFVPYRDMPAHYRWADVVVGCTPPGGIDKVLLEAMAAGCIVFTSNAVMRTHLGNDADRLVFSVDDPVALAQAVAGVTDFAELSSRMAGLVGKHTVTDVVSAITALL